MNLIKACADSLSNVDADFALKLDLTTSIDEAIMDLSVYD